MLLLQRRIGESIYIGDDIKITVLEATGRQVRLGIQAPRDIAVHREEIYHRIQREGNQAQTGGGSSSQEDNQYTPRRQSSSAPQMRYRSANPYRKNSPSYRNQENYDSSSNVSHHPFSNNRQDDED